MRIPVWGVVALVAAAAGVAAALPHPVTAQPPVLERFTVAADGHPIAVWARRPASPRAVVLLIHGRTWSSRPDFDLQVPGLERSTLSALAARGIAAYAVDLRGYGVTPRDASGWLTPRRAAADVLDVLTWVAAMHPTLAKPTVVGWSRGAAVAMLAAQRAPARLSSLVLYGFVIDPDLDFVDEGSDDVMSGLSVTNTAEAARSDFISPAVTPRAVIDAFVAQALRADPLLAPLRGDAEFNELNPAAVTVPTLVLYGTRDPSISADTVRKFVNRLATANRETVALPGGDHAAHLEDTHDAWISAVVSIATKLQGRR